VCFAYTLFLEYLPIEGDFGRVNMQKINRLIIPVSWISFIFLLSLLPLTASAQEDQIRADKDPTELSNESPEQQSKNNILELEFLLSSIYYFRGNNVFGETSQHEQNGVFSPSISWSIFNTGLWLKYAGYFQISGDNQEYLINSGVGHEQDLFLGWDHSFSAKWHFSSYFAYYFYPFSSEGMTGVRVPSVLEPSLGLSFHPTRLSLVELKLCYYASVQ
jgi:hypothetical protein